MKVTCKCDLVVCFDCRYADIHNCSFDYQKDAKETLTKNNPTVVSKKLEKI